MRTSFDASVPARKPKTHINRVLNELTARTDAAVLDPVAGEPIVEIEQDSAEEFTTVPTNGTPAPPQPRRASEPAAAPRESTVLQQDPATRVTTEWERLAALRERLDVAAKPRSIGNEPQHTAAAVRKLIDDLRARLDAALKERSEVAATLETTRASLARVEAELEQERATRAALEGQADERAQVAMQAVAEAEALAAERDLVLSELSERRRLGNEQTTLLADAEAAINRLSSQNESTGRELVEAHELCELRAAEIADLEARLQSEAADRSRVESRCRELEARLTESASAMHAIKSMVSPQR